jgi:hypothetical protein
MTTLIIRNDIIVERRREYTRPTFRWALMQEATRRYLEADPMSANYRRFKQLRDALLARSTVDLTTNRAFWAVARRVMSEHALARTARILGATP